MNYEYNFHKTKEAKLVLPDMVFSKKVVLNEGNDGRK
jgi:hypothetical protein